MITSGREQGQWNTSLEDKHWCGTCKNGHPRMHVYTRYPVSNTARSTAATARRLHHTRLANKQKQYFTNTETILDVQGWCGSDRWCNNDRQTDYILGKL